MFIAEPPRTQYDLHFQISGFDVRITPFFWAVAALLGWQWADGLHKAFESEGFNSPGQGALLLIWIGAVFVSILVHEMGHALAMRYYGMDAYIVLYHFGGLAVSDMATSFIRTGSLSRGGNQIVISAAGPGIQLALAAVIILLLKVSGYAAPFYLPVIGDPFGFSQGTLLPSPAVLGLVHCLLFVNIFWALLNLLPIYPLDGGQISRELFNMYSRDGIKNSLILSVATGIAVAIYGLMIGETFLMIMFGLLAFSSFQILQAYHGRGGGFGPW